MIVQIVKKCSDRALQTADYVILRIGKVFMRRLLSDAQGQEEIMQQIYQFLLCGLRNWMQCM